MNFTLYRINRQLDLLSTRTDRIKPGPCRDSLIRRITRLNVAHHLILAKMKKAVAPDQQSRVSHRFPARRGHRLQP
jgi:hypothetical protein